MSKEFEIQSADEELLRTIDKKFKLIADNPKYYLARQARVQALIDNLGNVSQWWALSSAERRARMFDEDDGAGQKVSKGELKARSIKSVAAASLAWTAMREATIYYKSNTLGVLTPSFLSHIAGMIDSRNNEYRNNDQSAEIFQGYYQAPSGFQVEDLVKEMTSALKKSKAHPVNNAAFAHLTLVGLQPFRYANKRLARLIQGSILVDAGLPPIIVHPLAREEYAGQLMSGLVGIRYKQADLQRHFYDYVANRVDLDLNNLVSKTKVRR